MISRKLSPDYGAIYAREDLHNFPEPMVVLVSDRTLDDRIELRMSPKLARKVARRLKAHADFIDPPKKKRRS